LVSGCREYRRGEFNTKIFHHEEHEGHEGGEGEEEGAGEERMEEEKKGWGDGVSLG
jgi:hypothetical protein